MDNVIFDFYQRIHKIVFEYVIGMTNVYVCFFFLWYGGEGQGTIKQVKIHVSTMITTATVTAVDACDNTKIRTLHTAHLSTYVIYF